MKEIKQHIRGKNQDSRTEIQEARIKNQDKRFISFIKKMELNKEFAAAANLFVQNEEQVLKYNGLNAIQFNNLTVCRFNSFKIDFDNYVLQRKDVDYIRICLN